MYRVRGDKGCRGCFTVRTRPFGYLVTKNVEIVRGPSERRDPTPDTSEVHYNLVHQISGIKLFGTKKVSLDFLSTVSVCTVTKDKETNS